MSYMMKISGHVIDWILDTALIEMAFKRKEAINRISNYNSQIASYLVKHLYYDASSEYKNHWGSEINAGLNIIDDITLKGGKRLSGEVYYEYLFNRPLGTIIDLEQHISTIDRIDGMGHHTKIGSVQELHETLEKILHTVSYDLSNNKLERIDHYIEKFK